MSPEDSVLIHRSATDRLAPCCEETAFQLENEAERLTAAGDGLASAVRAFLAGTPYRHTAPTQAEKDSLANALGAYDRERRGC